MDAGDLGNRNAYALDYFIDLVYIYIYIYYLFREFWNVHDEYKSGYPYVQTIQFT